MTITEFPDDDYSPRSAVREAEILTVDLGHSISFAELFRKGETGSAMRRRDLRLAPATGPSAATADSRAARSGREPQAVPRPDSECCHRCGVGAVPDINMILYVGTIIS